MKRLLIVVLFVLLSFPTYILADEHLSEYRLELFGYRLGMSYDEATNIRAFHYTLYENGHAVTGVFDSLYVEETPFRVDVHFADGKIFKIIGRFDPTVTSAVTESLVKDLGRPNDSSKTLNIPNDNSHLLTHLNWAYPRARIDLVSSSKNTQFATVSMLATSEEPTSPKEGQ